MSGSINTGGGNVIINVRVNNQQAATAFGQLQTQLTQLRTYTNALDVEMRNVDRTLRYMAAGALAGVIVGLGTLAGELERQTVLLSTMEGSFAKANERIDQLVQLSRVVPFSLSAITDAFVKMRTAGINPITNEKGEGPLKNLLDAVAAFGGTEQQINRAAVAIQQMAGKGTVSMEELRQQLGEAIPTAIQSMAKGMNISVAELIDRVTKGTVTFREGVNAMLEEFKKNYAGAGELLNNTFFGSIRQLKTELDTLALSFNRAGGLDIFTAAIRLIQEALKDLNREMTSGRIKQAFDDFEQWAINNASQIGLFATAIGQFGAALGGLAGFIATVVSSMPADALAGGLIGWVLFGRFGLVIGAILGTFNETLEGVITSLSTGIQGMQAAGTLIGASLGELVTFGVIGFLLFGKTGFVIGAFFAFADSVVGLFRKTLAGLVAEFIEMWTFVKSNVVRGFTDPLSPIENFKKSLNDANQARIDFLATKTGPGSVFGDINTTPFGEWINKFSADTASNAEKSAAAVRKVIEQLRAMRQQVTANREEFDKRFGQPNAIGGPTQSDIDDMIKFNNQLESALDRRAASMGQAVDGWARKMNRVGDTFQATIDRMKTARDAALAEGRPEEAANLDKNIAKSQAQLLQFRQTIDAVVASEHAKVTGTANAALDKFQSNMRAIKEQVEAFSASNESGRKSEDAEVQRVEARYAQIQARIDNMRIAVERSKGSDSEQLVTLAQLKELQDQLNASREKAIEIARRKAQWETEDAQREAQRKVADASFALRREQLSRVPGGDELAEIEQRRQTLQGSLRQIDDEIRTLERRQLESGGKDTWVEQWLANLKKIRDGFAELYDQVGTFSEREARRSKQFFNEIGKALEDSFARGLETLITGTGSLKDVWNDLFRSISRSVSRYITDMLFQEMNSAAGSGGTGGLLKMGMSALASYMGGGGGFGTSGTVSGDYSAIAGSNFTSSGISISRAALGKVFDAGRIQRFAGGGAFSNRVVSGPTLFHLGEMGEAGPEAIMPLTRIGGKLGVAASGGGDKFAISITALDAASVRDLFYREGGALVGSLQQRTRLNRGLR